MLTGGENRGKANIAKKHPKPGFWSFPLAVGYQKRYRWIFKSKEISCIVEWNEEWLCNRPNSGSNLFRMVNLIRVAVLVVVLEKRQWNLNTHHQSPGIWWLRCVRVWRRRRNEFWGCACFDNIVDSMDFSPTLNTLEFSGRSLRAKETEKARIYDAEETNYPKQNRIFLWIIGNRGTENRTADPAVHDGNNRSNTISWIG